MDEGDFDGYGRINWFKSYYPDGSIGRTITYETSSKTTRVIYKSYHKSSSRLLTPMAIGQAGWAEKIYEGKLSGANREVFNGSAEGVSFFNENGVLTNVFSAQNYEALVQKFLDKSENETWETALKRLENYWRALKELLIKDGSDIEMDCSDFFTITFEKTVSDKDILQAEKRLGIILPKSYKHFIITKGLIKFGNAQEGEQRMLHPNELQSVTHMLDPTDTGDFESYFTISKEDREKAICFFEDQHDIQYDGWIAWDCVDNNKEEKNAILHMGCKNIFDWEKQIGLSVQSKNSMDHFISDYVDILIKEREP